MKVSLVQTDIVWGDPEANLAAAAAQIAIHPGSDLYLLPEMFTTGFATQPDARLDEDPERTLAWMKAQAARWDCAVAGSVAMRDADRCVNRFFFVRPDGGVTACDKRHLFTYGGERQRFSGGDRRVVVEWRGVRFLLLVCYDLRFPVWMRNRNDYDAILLVANWPVVRQDAWETLLKARAIENQCFVAGVNRVGKDPVCAYLGGSTLYNPYGEPLARCEDEKACVATGTVDMGMLEDYRAKFPVLADADDFILKEV